MVKGVMQLGAELAGALKRADAVGGGVSLISCFMTLDTNF